jgi:CheY-like chemotaxis protein
MGNLKGIHQDKGDHNMDQFRTTSVLLIDESKNQRAYWSEQLHRCSSDYQIVEAEDGQSGLNICRSRRVDCVVLELAMLDQSGLQALGELVRITSRPQIAVVILTRLTHRAVWELAKQKGAYACLDKNFTSGEDLEKTIQRAVAFVGQMPKEDLHSVPS